MRIKSNVGVYHQILYIVSIDTDSISLNLIKDEDIVCKKLLSFFREKCRIRATIKLIFWWVKICTLKGLTETLFLTLL